MYYIATYDVGTTAVKGVLVSSDGEIKTSELVQIKTYFQQDYKEQKPDDWFDAFIPRIVPYLSTNGGPIIGVQVENEYGSYGDESKQLL